MEKNQEHSGIYRLHLHVRPQARLESPGILARRLHAFILEAIQRVNPELSQRLHDGKERQAFSVYLDSDMIFIHSPAREVIHSLQKRLLLDSSIDLIDWQGTVQEIHTQLFAKEEIMRQFTPKFTLKFVTPTTFYQQGNYYPLPELVRLFSSATKVLEMCEGQVLSRSDIETWVRKIRIEYASFTTERVDFGKFNVIGFRGKLTLNLKALPPEEQERLWILAVYGSLMGFGYKTAWGLGQTRLEPFCQRL
ncbi:CRISPR system precrRNA processing endoribonuclease RAMP protein Cas6 [Thermoflavimicrobium dichotomicum]|uniref:CRISPR-associated endoribonuclease Cas6 n=1 Tax=Thermoflavimicrobium dichotomicum TaxID=46223 RepID=A0A1I3RCH5_9BACL|nr:CRISPR system precrRNA processing endoribonuclease RAMP protein Cas6 [Thermoflavimicrobium dichotomicum]SFJ43359.1 CRISPR-associated endoribonuclease Cas6 [Thermoflavimicrobium dichotomicum]